MPPTRRGRPDEGLSIVMNVRLTAPLHKWLVIEAEQRGVKLSTAARELLRERMHHFLESADANTRAIVLGDADLVSELDDAEDGD